MQPVQSLSTHFIRKLLIYQYFNVFRAQQSPDFGDKFISEERGDLQALSFRPVEIRDKHWTGLRSRTLDINPRAQERLCPPQLPAGWGPCGMEFPCK